MSDTTTVGDVMDKLAEQTKKSEAEQSTAAPDDVAVPTEASDLTHVVTRSFHGGGADLAAGEVVDASGWRNANRLVGMRYLRVLTIDDPEPVTDGERFFINDDALLEYIDSMPEDTIEEVEA